VLKDERENIMAKPNFLSTVFGKSVVAMVLALAIALAASEFNWNVVSTVFIFVFLIAAVVCVISFFFLDAKSSTAKTIADGASNQKAERDNIQHEPRSRETTNKPSSVLGDTGRVLMRRAVSGTVDAFLGGGTLSSSVRSKPSQDSSNRMTSEEPMTDETVSIEMQDLGGGSWKKMTTAPNNPASISVAFNNLRIGATVGRRLRAVGTRTGQLYDLR